MKMFISNNQIKLEILKSLWGFYDEPAFLPKGQSRFHISCLAPSTLVIDLLYVPCLYHSLLIVLIFARAINYFTIWGWGVPKRGWHISTFFHLILISLVSKSVPFQIRSLFSEISPILECLVLGYPKKE